MNKVIKPNLMIKLDLVLMTLLNNMLNKLSDALPSHTLTLKKTKVDITTKLSQKLRKM
jgi:hypothetical protein